MIRLGEIVEACAERSVHVEAARDPEGSGRPAVRCKGPVGCGGRPSRPSCPGSVGDLSAKALSTLHGAGVYTALSAAACGLLVSLPDHAARVLELAEISVLEGEGSVRAGWADLRAAGVFLQFRPVWLEMLDEHAPHLALADEAAGVCPTAWFLEHMAAVAPQAARPWLTGHTVQLAAAWTLLRRSDAGALEPPVYGCCSGTCGGRRCQGRLAAWCARRRRRAHQALIDEVWLSLARCSAKPSAQERAAKVDERAVGHPHSLDALLLATHRNHLPRPQPCSTTLTSVGTPELCLRPP